MRENNDDPFINHNYSRWVVAREGRSGEPLTRIIHEEHFPFSLPLFSSVG